jgi:hypothetical protein
VKKRCVNKDGLKNESSDETSQKAGVTANRDTNESADASGGCSEAADAASVQLSSQEKLAVQPDSMQSISMQEKAGASSNLKSEPKPKAKTKQAAMPKPKSKAQIRREVFQRANNQCENCGSTYALEIDHMCVKKRERSLRNARSVILN